MLPRNAVASSSGPDDEKPLEPEVLQDRQDCIPLSRILGEGDVILLLTPLVAPVANPAPPETLDPFEPLGRSIARRHPRTRHVPYTPKHGVTSTHVGFIKRAKAVIFVITGLAAPGQSSQVELAEIAREVGDHCRHIIVACLSVRHLGNLEASFPTILQIPGYTRPDLEAAAELLFGERVNNRSNGSQGSPVLPRAPSIAGSTPSSLGAPRTLAQLAPKPSEADWNIQVWDANRDITAIHGLWCQNLPGAFRLQQGTLLRLLRRDGYAMHYVVRDGSDLVGFCATYTTYADAVGEKLIGSLAVIIVKAEHRRRGIGRRLHQHALIQLTKTRGMSYIQLGSTFPRLLYGIPVGLTSESWFARRGWAVGAAAASISADTNGPYKGPGSYQVADWMLNLEDWPENAARSSGGGAAGLEFRPCTHEEASEALKMVTKESERKDSFGWYDQYIKILNSFEAGDVIVGKAGDEFFAAALTYTRSTGSPVADDLPWAETIGGDVGGVTCICIVDDSPAIANKASRDTIMIRLLDACVTALKGKNMHRMLLDGVQGGSEGFSTIGFKKWAQYHGIWLEASRIRQGSIVHEI